jgi:YidC/Oxa1 family membrane protein insertase
MDAPLTGAIAHLVSATGGNLGAAIFAFSLTVRLIFFPLTLWLARRGQRRQEVLRNLQPEIDALKIRFKKQPEKLFGETQALYRRHDIGLFDLTTLGATFLQLPVFAMVYGAVRSALKLPASFLWIRNLAAPDLILTLVVLVTTAASVYMTPNLPEQARTSLIVIQVIMTGFMLWKLAAGLGLYWAASSFVNLLQSLWLRRSASLARLA